MPREIIEVETETKKSVEHQVIKEFTRFGKELKISPKSFATLNEPGYKVEYFVPTISVNVGIGADHAFSVTMTKDAYDAFIQGEEISITTVGEFQNRFVKKQKK